MAGDPAGSRQTHPPMTDSIEILSHCFNTNSLIYEVAAAIEGANATSNKAS